MLRNTRADSPEADALHTHSHIWDKLASDLLSPSTDSEHDGVHHYADLTTLRHLRLRCKITILAITMQDFTTFYLAKHGKKMKKRTT